VGDDSVIGCVGSLIVATRGVAGVGEVLLNVRGKPAKPIIEALGTQLPGCEIDISALSVVVQHGPERAWDWSVLSTIRLATSARA